MAEIEEKNNRLVPRLERQSHHCWQLVVNEDELITKNITNISPTGLAFKAPLRSEFKTGQKLRIHLSLEKDSGFECEGKIVWAKKVDDSSGKGQQFGMEFDKIPDRIDALIMKEINHMVLRARREALASGGRPSSAFLHSRKKYLELQSMATSLFGAVMGLALAAALIAATYLHQQLHSQDSLAHKINQAFVKRMAATVEK